MLNEIGRSLDAIFFFDLPDDVALERIESRASAEGRTDDTRDATARRLQIYHEQTEPVVEHYRATGKLVPLHAGRSVDEVFAEIADALEQVDPHDHPQVGTEIAKMAAAGALVAETIAYLGEQLEPGITTGELDRLAEELIESRGGITDVEGLSRFPGRDLHFPELDGRARIPGAVRGARRRPDHDRRRRHARRLHRRQRLHVRRRRDRPGGAAAARHRARALTAGIAQALAGNRVGDISAAVQQHVEAAGFAVVRSLVGHGVGRAYHEDPHIPNFGQPGRGPLLSEGMTLAIEPMITAGRPDVYVHDDQWSISTEDGSLAAHFEHTVAITATGPKILTAAAVPLLS